MLTRRASLLSAIAGCVTAPLISARAADIWTSAPARARHSTLRLLAGGGRAVPALAGYVGAIEIAMDAGFKTYWRDPGDSGVPPVFDWSGSENLDRIEILWPAPVRFPDAGSFSIGYLQALRLPFALVAKDAAKPVILRLKLDYAVCERQCIPEQAQAQLALPQAGDSPHIPLIAAALERVPRRVAMGDLQHGLGLRAVTTVPGDKPLLVAEIVAPRFAKGLDLFVEAPAGAFFGEPKFTPLGLAAPGDPLPLAATRVEMPLEQRPSGTPVWDVRLTLVTDDVAIEAAARLDGLNAPR